MDFKVTTPPTHLPVSVAEAKRHLRVTDSNSDTVIANMIAAAFRWCELYQGLSWLYQTITFKRDGFADTMFLPMPPLVAVDSITYVDSNGATQTLAATVYDVDTTSSPGRVTLAYDQTWPATRSVRHAVTITAKAGHVATFTSAGIGTSLTVSGGHVYSVNDFVHLYGVDLPAGFAAATDYYVASVAGGVITLAAAEGGDAIAATDAGTGTQYIDALGRNQMSAALILLADMYLHRKDIIEGGISSLPHAVKNLLGIERMVHV